MARGKFPVLAVILLIFAVIWFFNDIGYYQIDLPWIPVILGVIAIGMIFNRFKE